MKKILLATLSIVGIMGVMLGTVAEAGYIVTATVTPGNYSVSVDVATAAYGSMLLSTTQSSATITATNSGSLTEKINITGSDATYTDKTWTLSNTAVGTDTYVHAFSTKATAPATGATLSADPTTDWVGLDTSAITFKASLAAAGTQAFKLDMRTPSAASTNTVFGSEYSSVVTLTAVAP